MFRNNINSLSKINSCLTQKLINISFDKAREVVDINKSKSDDIIFVKNDTPLESIENPIEEAFYEVNSCIKSCLCPFDFVIIYGLGVGYVLDYVFEKFDCKIILVEPDINVMRTAFEIVDYAKYLESGRVFMTCENDEVYKFLSKKYLINDKVEMIFLKSYLKLYSGDIQRFTEKVYEVCNMKIMDINTIKKNSEDWVNSSINFIKNSGQTYPISLLNNRFEGKTALIVGAGPSLRDNIDYIKKYSDRLVIFAVNRAIDFLVEHDVIPNFAIFTDTRYVLHTFNYKSPRLKDINFIMDIKADVTLYNLLKKRCFIYYPDNFELAKILADKNQYVKLYKSAGTSTLSALISAKELGCENIILSGVDLAFKNDTPYCSDSYLVNLEVSKDKVKIGSMEKKVVLVESVNGDRIRTREDYAIFIKQFENFFKENPKLKVFNTSSFGAFIDGTLSMSFDEIMANLEVIYDNNSIEDIINDTLYNSNYNPIELKKELKSIIEKELKINLAIKVMLNKALNNSIEDENFYISVYNVLEKISTTIFLSQILQFELLNSTKWISLEKSNQKRTLFEEFLKNVLKKIEELDKKLMNI